MGNKWISLDGVDAKVNILEQVCKYAILVYVITS